MAGSRPGHAGTSWSAASDDAFDDFASVRGEPQPPDFPDLEDEEDLDDIAERLGWGDDTPSTQDTKPTPPWFNKYYVFGGAGAVALLVVVALIMLLQADPPELSTTPFMPPTSTAPPATSTVTVDLKEPDVRGNQVVLTWTSTSDKFDFAVLITRPDADSKTVFVPDRKHTLAVPIDPVGGYCFQIEATNSATSEPVHYSQARPIRGDDCRH